MNFKSSYLTSDQIDWLENRLALPKSPMERAKSPMAPQEDDESHKIVPVAYNFFQKKYTLNKNLTLFCKKTNNESKTILTVLIIFKIIIAIIISL